MHPLQQYIAELPLITYADYIRAARNLPPLSSNSQEGLHAQRIGLLTSFTTQGLGDILKIQALASGISSDIYSADYSQYVSEIHNPRSSLYRHDPDLVIVFVDTQTLLGEVFYHPYEKDAEWRERWVQTSLNTFASWIEHLKKNSRAAVLIHDLEIPLYSPLGILESKQPFGIRSAIETFNKKLKELFREDPRVFVFEYDAFASAQGKLRLSDAKMYYLADMKLDVNLFPDLCRAYLPYLKALTGMSKKCLVLDLDQTLWGGILGEDGYNGIRLAPTGPGRAYWEFQHYLLGLFQRGIILTVNSRNNPDEVLRVLRDHPYMILRPNHFAALRINWNDKASNIKSIAEEIRLGLDSLVFIDDDKINRDLVRRSLPEVTVVDLPDDPSLYPGSLKSLDCFNSLQLTEEDKIRGAAYASQKERDRARQDLSFEDYLQSLETVLTIEPARDFSIARIAQLTQKTNQFNLTTRRYSEPDIQRFSLAPNFRVWSFQVTDKFGDSGIVAVVIIELHTKCWRIDTFLMSCRVLARRIEDSILAFLGQKAHEAGVETLIGEFIATEKNSAAKNFYQNHGFKLSGTENKIERYELHTPALLKAPESIKWVIQS